MNGSPRPTLDELLNNPGRAQELPSQDARDLLVRLAGLQSLLLARALIPITGQRDPGDDRLLTIPEVAIELQVSKAHVYELCRRGEIPSVKVGKHVRVLRLALRKWLAQKDLTG